MKIGAVAARVLAWGCLCAAGYAQSELRLLDLDVVSLDSHGQPVTDLTADDFQITDAGKPQKLVFFRKNDERGEPSRSQADVGAQFSNRTNQRRPNAIVILFDLLNMGYGTRLIAANNLVRDLRAFRQADNLYLYLLSVNGKFFSVHGISPVESSNPEAPDKPWTTQIKPLMDGGMRAVMGFRTPDIDVFVRTQVTFASLVALGEQLEAVPGRKIIVWVTAGVPAALGENRSDTGFPIDFTPQIRELSQALERSHTALYPVRQVMLGSPDDIGENSGGAGATGGAGTGLESLATLNLFADFTGGRRSTDKDIGGVIEQAITDLHFFYQIGYDVPPGNWDDKFHKLRVTSKRKGVRIQAKAGYYAWKGATGTRTQSAFTATAAGPFDAEEIGLWANVSRDTADPDEALVHLRIDARDIALAEAGDRYTAHLGIMSVGYQPNGFIATGPVSQLDIDYSPAERDNALRDGIAVDAKLSDTQNTARFRLMVFDRGSNAVGSITIPASTFRPPQP